ncbi:MAG: tetratricopeptide repeat protein [Chlorobiales bacterium]|nr:tetratricopeptide repeat protein [Chlorobiales bacterium]
MSVWSFEKFTKKDLYSLDWKLGTFGLDYDDNPATPEYIEAISDECRSRGIFSDDAFFENNRGLEFASQGDFANAESCFRNAISLCPLYLNAYVNLGASLTDQGRPREALEILERALRLGFTPDLGNNIDYAKSLLNG